MVRPRQVSDEQIIEVARQLFFEHGPGVSTNTIAAALSISQAALFKRFGTKAALMRRALRVPNPAWIELLDDGPDPTLPLEVQLETVALAIDDFFEQLAPAASVMRMSGCQPKDFFADGERPTPLRGIDALTRWLEQAHAQGLARVEQPRATAMSLLGALHIRPFLSHMFQAPASVDGPSYVRQVVATHWRAIAPEVHA